MSKNKKIKSNTSENLSKFAEQAGMLLMTAAAVTGMLELPTRPDNRIIVPGRASFAMANEYNELNEPIRREREDPAPHYANYSVTQRTHSRAANK